MLKSLVVVILACWMSFGFSNAFSEFLERESNIRIGESNSCEEEHDFFAVLGNTPPTWVVLSPQSLEEGSEFRVAILATDPDENQTITYSLGAGAPAHATIETTMAGADFVWSPKETQGPDTYNIELIASDGIDETTQVVSFSVSEVNEPPLFGGFFPDISIDEGQPFVMDLTGNDSDYPVQTLTFSLGNHPDGMTLSSGGHLEFTPSELQGGEVHAVQVLLTDGVDISTQEFQLTIVEVNDPPMVETPPSVIEIDEGQQLQYQIIATDTDVPNQTLTFLADYAPGVSIDAQTGLITWDTSEENDGDHTFTFSVNDGVDNVVIELHVLVKEVNQAPTLDGIGDFEVDAGDLLEFEITAQDSDLPAQSLSFSMNGAPVGATLSPSENGANFNWTAQTAGDYTIEFVVSDDQNPALTASETITITVNAVGNRPPVLSQIGNKEVYEDLLLTFVAVASDPDSGQVISYSLAGDVPYGARIHPVTGKFVFRPATIQSPHTFTFDVIATDNGIPPMSTSTSVTVEVKRETRTINAMWGWGVDSYGSMGTGTTGGLNGATPIHTLLGQSRLFTGPTVGNARDALGNWMVFGNSNYGAWGTGFIGQYPVPTPVSELTGFLEVGGGSWHRSGIKENGDFFTWGKNSTGQLGLNHYNNELRPVRVGSYLSFRPSTGYGDSNILVHSKGSSYNVLRAGQNNWGHLGLGNYIDGVKQFTGNPLPYPVVQAVTNWNGTMVLHSNGLVSTAGQGAFGPFYESIFGSVTKIAAGGFHMLMLHEDGHVYGIGYSGHGQLGFQSNPQYAATLVPILSDIVDIACSGYTSYALKDDGTVWAWGLNNQGQGGDPANQAYIALPHQVPNISGVVRISAVDQGCIAYQYGDLDQAPVLDPIGELTATQLAPFSFTFSASDPDIGQSIRFSVQSLSNTIYEMNMNPTTGELTFTPTLPKDQIWPQTIQVRIIATDDHQAQLSDSQIVTIKIAP